MPAKKEDVYCDKCGTVCKNGRRHFGRNKHHFCSMECYLSFKTKKVSVECENCGKSFLKKRSDIARSNHNFCSHECVIEYQHKHRKKKNYFKLYNEMAHRAIAEEKIGRKLLSSEQVHHIDGNARNNDPNNLMIVTAQEHGRIHAAQKRRNLLGQFVAKTTPP